MAGVFKRASDKARGKAGKWTCWWIGEDGRKHHCAGVTDKAKSLEIAARREAEARRLREGIADPTERVRREAGLKPVADHIEDYRLSLLAKGNSPRHCGHVAGAIRRLLADTAVTSVADLAADRIQEALGRLRLRRSARTCNHALKVLLAFATWLEHSNRIKEVPRGLLKIPEYNEEADRGRVRRALSESELERLLAAAEQGGPIVARRPGRGRRPSAWITGPERAALYRLAMGTGFRADELRTLTPERFDLDGDAPTVTVLACYSKNGKLAIQPITRELAAALRKFIAGKEPGKPVLSVPEKKARMLRRDLEAAGIPYETAAGVADFHALRHSYITHLIRRGVSTKIVQALARHSTITLTLDRYTHLGEGDIRGALEGEP